jgi:DNA-binding CsgD family transcriptional regulator
MQHDRSHDTVDTFLSRLSGVPAEHPRVALQTRDPSRLGSLLAALATEGVIADAAAPVRLVDVTAGEKLPDAGGMQVVLTERPAQLASSAIAGVLPRDASANQIAAAVRAVAAGLMVRALPEAEQDAAEQAGRAPASLTPREMEILDAVSDGLSNKAVARRLNISAHTVKFHLEAVFTKLAVRTRAEAVRQGLRRGLINI